MTLLKCLHLISKPTAMGVTFPSTASMERLDCVPWFSWHSTLVKTTQQTTYSHASFFRLKTPDPKQREEFLRKQQWKYFRTRTHLQTIHVQAKVKAGTWALLCNMDSPLGDPFVPWLTFLCILRPNLLEWGRLKAVKYDAFLPGAQCRPVIIGAKLLRRSKTNRPAARSVNWMSHMRFVICHWQILLHVAMFSINCGRGRGWHLLPNMSIVLRKRSKEQFDGRFFRVLKQPALDDSERAKLRAFRFQKL